MTLAWTVLTINSTFANMGAPPEPRQGNISGDSYFQDISVISEELVINLSDIDEGQPVKVRAKYVIECSKLIKPVDLIFIANNLTESRYSVDLDGNFVNGYLTLLDTMPSTWLPPDSINWDNRKIPYTYGSEGLIQFRFDSLTPGQHTIIVDYDAQASEWFDNDESAIIRTFVYILKPTDKWKRFENFHLVVFTPTDWEFSSNLDLKRATSYSLSGDWDELPAQYLTIAIRKPPYKATTYSILFLTGSWAGYILLALFWLIRVAKYRLQGRIKRFIKILNTLVVAIITAVFFFYIYYKNQDLVDYWLDNHSNPLMTYGTGYFILTFPFICIIAGIIVFTIDYMLTRRLKTRMKN